MDTKSHCSLPYSLHAVTDSSGFKGSFLPLLALPPGWPRVTESHMAAWDREHSNLCNSCKGRRDWTDKASLRLAASWKADRTHLKVHGDRGPSPLLLVIGGQQFNLRTDLGFLHASHTFYPIRESPEVRRCPSLFSPSLHVLRADRSTKQTLLPQALPLQHPRPNTHTYFQTMAFSLALYFAFPFIQITCTPLVFRGVGIRT